MSHSNALVDSTRLSAPKTYSLLDSKARGATACR
jgi:hypothetical protein